LVPEQLHLLSAPGFDIYVAQRWTRYRCDAIIVRAGGNTADPSLGISIVLLDLFSSLLNQWLDRDVDENEIGDRNIPSQVVLSLLRRELRGSGLIGSRNVHGLLRIDKERLDSADRMIWITLLLVRSLRSLLSYRRVRLVNRSTETQAIVCSSIDRRPYADTTSQSPKSLRERMGLAFLAQSSQ
jgi:hypothetical protein